MAYIGLDLGSTYTKIALLENGRYTRMKQVPAPARLPSAGDLYEVDAEAYFAQVFSLLNEYADNGQEGILLSTQMHGYVLTDRRFAPLTPYVSWQDKIGAKHLDELKRLLTAEDVASSGVPLKANLALSSLWGRLQEGFRLPQHARLCTLGGYMIGRLTGEFACHMTNAAPTGLADIRNGNWNTELVEKAGLSGLELPRIFTRLVPAGSWRGIPVYPDLGDQQACAAGAKLSQGDSLHVSVGTAGLIGVLHSQWSFGDCENRPWLFPGLYLRTVSGLPGGRDVSAVKESIRNALGGAVSEDVMWRWMVSLDESVLPQAHSHAAAVSDFYKQLSLAYRKAAARLDSHIVRIAFSGGGSARNPLLRESLQSVFDAEACPDDCDVMRGLLAIIAQLEEYA